MLPAYLIVDLAGVAMVAFWTMCGLLAALWLYALVVHIRRFF